MSPNSTLKISLNPTFELFPTLSRILTSPNYGALAASFLLLHVCTGPKQSLPLSVSKPVTDFFKYLPFRGVRGPCGKREVPGSGAQIRPGPGHRRRGQEGQPLGCGEAKLYHGKTVGKSCNCAIISYEH